MAAVQMKGDGVLEHGGNSGSDETWWLYRYILKLELSEDIFKGMM